MNFKIEQYKYDKTKQDASYVAELATELSLLKNLEENSHLKPSSVNNNFEERQLRQIKTCISNIYLILDLYKVKGIADEIFNSTFEPK